MACKNILSTNRAFRLHAFFSALVFFKQFKGHARITIHAMKIINAQSPSPTTHITRWAVVNVSPWFVIKELADPAVITSHQTLATLTMFCTRQKKI